jgi:RND family efflux transporter MFP subunit
MERTITATGTLGAREKSILSAKVSGRLQRLTVDIGSVVAPGDLLAQIEPKDYELGVQQAEAALGEARAAVGLPAGGDNDSVQADQISSVKQARAVLEEATKNRERIRSLHTSGIAPQSELDTVEAAYTVAATRYELAVEDAHSRIATVAQRRAELELARKRLADTQLVAPFDGVVQSRPAGIGQYVAAGTPTIELVKTDPLRLRLDVSERDSGLVRTGQTVRLLTKGDTNLYIGTITRLSPALTEDTRMLLVEADVPSRGTLRPGLFARAEIVIVENEPALSVPEAALTTFAGLEKVVVIDDGKALEKLVTTGRRRGGWVEVLSGVSNREEVVLNPAGLRTGNPVTVRAQPGATNVVSSQS